MKNSDAGRTKDVHSQWLHSLYRDSGRAIRSAVFYEPEYRELCLQQLSSFNPDRMSIGQSFLNSLNRKGQNANSSVFAVDTKQSIVFHDLERWKNVHRSLLTKTIEQNVFLAALTLTECPLHRWVRVLKQQLSIFDYQYRLPTKETKFLFPLSFAANWN